MAAKLVIVSLCCLSLGCSMTYRGEFTDCVEGGRKATLCCTPNLDIFAPATCEKQLCKTDKSFRCGMDPNADVTDDPDDCDPVTEDCSQAVSRRRDDLSPLLHFLPEGRYLEKRKGDRTELQAQLTVLGQLITFVIVCRYFPGSTHLHASTPGRPASSRAYRYAHHLLNPLFQLYYI